ncbi:MAG: hypothetical protein HQL46_12045 [Gammaproteobacteria bacterium]|nr:hypothetical protein [Gammaproteobacteria bacterium]
MEQDLLETHESLVVDMGNLYLENMEHELAKKYQDRDYNIYPSLTDSQFDELKSKHNKVSEKLFMLIYAEFLDLKPTSHLNKLLDAFHASGGNVDIEPNFDEKNQKLEVSVNFVIKETTLRKIEGLSPIEDILVKMNAMIQIDTLLSDPNAEI